MSPGLIPSSKFFGFCFPQWSIASQKNDRHFPLLLLDKKELSEKRTKTENSENTPAKLESPSPQKTSTSKNCGKNVSNYWLMKSEPESRLEKGVDMKVRLYLCQSCWFDEAVMTWERPDS